MDGRLDGTLTIPTSSGTTDYEELENKPSINGVELIGNKTSQDLGLNAGSFIVTVTGHLDSGFQVESLESDKTHSEIEAALNEGKVAILKYQVMGANDLSATVMGYGLINPYGLLYSSEISNSGTVIKIKINEQDEVTLDSCTGTNIFLINFTYSWWTETYTADKTLDEIAEASSNGDILLAHVVYGGNTDAYSVGKYYPSGFSVDFDIWLNATQCKHFKIYYPSGGVITTTETESSIDSEPFITHVVLRNNSGTLLGDMRSGSPAHGNRINPDISFYGSTTEGSYPSMTSSYFKYEVISYEAGIFSGIVTIRIKDPATSVLYEATCDDYNLLETITFTEVQNND